jgi:uncharacterized heparinase superfamily protein
MLHKWIGKIRRGLKKPPTYIAQRIWTEIKAQSERYAAPLRARKASSVKFAKQEGYADTGQWWTALGQRPYLSCSKEDLLQLDAICPAQRMDILHRAALAMNNEVNLLGSGTIQLGQEIDWSCDYKSGFNWPSQYCRDIEYNNPERPSDVKFPWELSRMQWLIPVGQAYLLTNEEQYAKKVRDILLDWIDANPYAYSINWACTMDVALRLITWTWFFHAFWRSAAWSNSEFQEKFLRSLYLHADFTERHLEKSDINGNHYTADAAGLVYAGLFFGHERGGKWLSQGWSILASELPKQIFPDGVDFEASVPYHRLVLELFLYPALYRRVQGLDIPEEYQKRLVAMASFVSAYSRPNGSVPLWGDADDARTLPFGDQALNDHRYLIGLVGHALDKGDLREQFSGSKSEILWLMGASVARTLAQRKFGQHDAETIAFPDGGFYVLRNQQDHIFVDCGPVGLGGRGGHGHNDILSFEAVLAGTHLVSDCGAYLYTADYRERNLFRSTAYHNTPKIDDQEINRFIGPDDLWNLHNDALPAFYGSTASDRECTLSVGHGGYERLTSPLTIRRHFLLDHLRHGLTVRDEFLGDGIHTVEIPVHLAVGISVETQSDDGELILRADDGKQFLLKWSPALPCHVEPARISQSYGVYKDSTRLAWKFSTQHHFQFELTIVEKLSASEAV